MNPYASHLDSQKPAEVIAATAAKLASLTAELSEAQLNQAPAAGKWSVREILSHLADAEIVFAFRIRQTLSEPHHVIQPFDQDHWAKPYLRYSAQLAIATFTAVRNWNLAVINGLTPEDLQRPVTHPERGTMTLQTVVETMGGHDMNHIHQIEGIVSRSASA